MNGELVTIWFYLDEVQFSHIKHQIFDIPHGRKRIKKRIKKNFTQKVHLAFKPVGFKAQLK